MQKCKKKNIPTTKKQNCYMCETSTITKPKVVSELVNEMRALIQEMKTVIEAITKKLSKDPNSRVATSQERQAKRDRKSSEALSSGVTSVAGPLQTPPKKKTKAKLPTDRQVLGTKQEKIDPAQEWEAAQERTDLSPWKQRVLFTKLGKYRWTPKWKTRKHIQKALKNKVTYGNQ